MDLNVNGSVDYLVACLSGSYGQVAKYERTDGQSPHISNLNQFKSKFGVLKKHDEEKAFEVLRQLRKKFGLSNLQRKPSSIPNCPSNKRLTKEVSNVVNFQDKLVNVNWKKVRYIAFVVYGNRCSCCGTGPEDDIITVDHIIPRADRPDLECDLRNLQILCGTCNVGKCSWDKTDWRTEQQKIDAITVYHFPNTINTFLKRNN